MVVAQITKNGHKWVNTWPPWVGKIKGSDQELTIPAHLTFRFEDGKIIEEYHNYDTQEMMAELALSQGME